MLTEIHEKAKGKFASIVLALLAVPFALWGVNSYFEAAGRVVVATVDGKDITETAYRVQLERARRVMQQALPPGMSSSAFETPAFRQRVLDDMIDRQLLMSATEKRGYRISDELLSSAIRADPRFQRDGRFDPSTYEIVLRNAELTPAAYEAQVRAAALAAQVEAGFGMSTIVTGADVTALARLELQKRAITMTTIPADRFLAGITIPEADAKAWYDTHHDSFRIPERVRLAYVVLSAETVAADNTVSDEELRAAYDAEIARFTTPERRTASHILITAPPGDANADKAALDKANALRKQLLAGANFAALARAESADPGSAAKGGDLGEISPGAMVPEFEAAVKALKTGEISAPVRTRFGYHLIKLDALTPAKVQPFDSVRTALLAEIRKKRGEERFFDLTEQFNNLIYEQADSLKPAADALGLEIRETDWLTRDAGSGIAANPKVRAAAFEADVLAQGRNSTAIEADPNSLVAIRVIGHEAAAVRAFADVRPEVERALRAERAHDKARASAEAMLQALAAGTAFTDAANTHGGHAPISRTVTRQDAGGLDARITEAVFRAARPEAGKPTTGSVDLGTEGYAVYKVESVTDAAADANTAAVRDQLARQRGAAWFGYDIAGLRERADIKIYDDKL